MVHIIKSYLQFLCNSKNQHGVHSPFVYNLVTKCFNNTTKHPEYSILKEYRNSLLANNETIEVTDFGASSRVFKSNTRAVSQIAKTAGISSKRAKLLFRIVNYLQPNTILEIGTSLGLATSALSLGLEAKTKTNRAMQNKDAKIITLEGCPNTMAIAKNQCQLQNINNIDFINTEFSSYLTTQHPRPKTQDLIYFNGNHSKNATLEYFELLLPTTANDSVWIFNAIHWSKDMEEAWKIIKNHPKVTVTIDTFQWGIVFFRSEQKKEHFVIRV